MLKWLDFTAASPSSSFIHRLDPRLKILVLVINGFLVVFLDNYIALAILLVGAMAGMLAARLSVLRLAMAAVMILVGLWGAVFSQALFYEQFPRTAIVTLISPQTPVLGELTKGLYIYREGVVYGLKQGLRMTAMTTLGLLVCWTTDSRLLLLGLVRLRLPYSLAFMAVTAVRFIPILAQETLQVMTASSMRGGRKFSFQVLSPILAHCLRRAGTLAVAVESRAFRAYGGRTYLEELRFSPGEKLSLGVFLVAAILVVAGKISYWSYQYGLFYHSSLRQVYEIAGTYL